ncbi:chaperone modulator CbpM [Affinibrenneria salicis]|uniref:Chaperone modulator CbpM n=1 Tax=Affinibrenneria salicis TaxID=2590031 RepID=A0A5J5FQL9_9GAMM|nr:chaperone modulator CbpM [Affinibrenneria salicis]KAA8995275.1 chaperone modulator CbpM [Affinibrenneria salicis]
MADEFEVTFTVTEFCRYVGISHDELQEIVGLGVVEPKKTQTTEWCFDHEALCVVRRATQLHRELDLDWSGIAVALTLMGNIEQLRDENQRLRRQLRRFLTDRPAS